MIRAVCVCLILVRPESPTGSARVAGVVRRSTPVESAAPRQRRPLLSFKQQSNNLPHAIKSAIAPTTSSPFRTTTVPHSPHHMTTSTDSSSRPRPVMQGIVKLREAIERHRENKDINIRYKTPLTSKRPHHSTAFPHPLTSSTERNVENLIDKQNVYDACNPAECSREVRISEWLRVVS